MKKKVMFVDDEPRILDGLQRMLRRRRDEWDMTFVGGAEAALEAMEREPVDVLVTDMRMPGMDGAALLARVQLRSPRTVRIVLSGHSETEAALRSVAVAHQFLAKPCDADVLSSVVERASALHELLGDESILDVLGTVDTLPAVPRVYNQLVAALADDEVRVERIAQIVEQDVGISAKILQLVNSSFFGIAREITSIREATTYLGTNTIRDLTLGVEAFRMVEGARIPAGYSVEREQRHAFRCARIASRLAPDKRAAEQAYLAALLHDIGKLVLAVELPERFARAQRAASEAGEPFHAAERRIGRATHAEIGACILGLWGMPYPIVEAVANHHVPARVAHEGFAVLTAVHVADALAHELGGGAGAGLVDEDYLRSVGLEGRLEGWRELAAAELQAGQEAA